MNVKDGRGCAALTRRVGTDTARRSTRRTFLIAAASLPALALAGGARAQVSAKVPRIGLLSQYSPSETSLWHQALRLGLRDFGWVEGKNISIEYRYGPDSVWSYIRVAELVDKIFKGTKAGEIPIEQPTKFKLIVNMKTAKALGITFPPSILVLANRVIE